MDDRTGKIYSQEECKKKCEDDPVFKKHLMWLPDWLTQEQRAKLQSASNRHERRALLSIFKKGRK